jgi:acetylornithine deacetylase/succinyl-diaminopimelate desuccinylase-like protein
MVEEQINQAINYYHTNYQKLLDEFLLFLKIPSISTSDVNKSDVLDAADFLVRKLKELGMQNVKAWTTPKHPIVIAEHLTDPSNPTILLYGHYDVQPPDPINQWETPPFEPTFKDNYLFARGASDMKGQIWAMISALQAIIKTSDLPVNIKFLIEGEEEIGSPSLNAFLNNNKAMLRSDIVLNPDADMLSPDKPTIIYALRGMAYFELRIFGPNADLHSGIFGGVIANPANIISKVIASMHDQSGKVTIPNFYTKVRKISRQERSELLRIGMDDEFFLGMTGVPALAGEVAFHPVERIGSRPTLDVNGIYSGYIEPGAKTIIPSYALAKFSTRLVPDQIPDEIFHSLQDYLGTLIPNSVRWELDYLSGAKAYITDEKAPGVDLFKKALKDTWHVDPIMKREGGSIPVATAIKEILGLDSIITGFGLPDDQIHSPNERLHIPTHKKGVEALIRFFMNFN